MKKRIIIEVDSEFFDVVEEFVKIVQIFKRVANSNKIPIKVEVKSE
ncbi:hypothetical protein J7J18_03660 [bacterium]|nr:hypothetical protein [bacterium]